MHKVKSFARSKAHAHGYNPWSHDQDPNIAPASGVPNLQPNQPPITNTFTNHDAGTIPGDVAHDGAGSNAEENVVEPKKPVYVRFYRTLKIILFSSWVNILLVFVPVGIACQAAGINPTIVFVMNAIAIIPLAGLLSFATEAVAHRLGDTIGALMNVTFGNAVELIIFIALVKNEIRIVQASLLGSVLANLLLILGMCFLVGGLRFREQVYNSTVTQMSACLLSLSVMSLLLPTAFHASFNDNSLADNATLKVSRGTSILVSHSYMYESTPQHIIDEESHPGLLAHFGSSSSSSTSSSRRSSMSSSDGESISGRIRNVRNKFRRKSSVHESEDGEKSSKNEKRERRRSMSTASPEVETHDTHRGRRHFREKNKEAIKANTADESAIVSEAADVPALMQGEPSTFPPMEKRSVLRTGAPRLFSFQPKSVTIAPPTVHELNHTESERPDNRRANSLPPRLTRLQSERPVQLVPYIVPLNVSSQSLVQDKDNKNNISRTSAVFLLLGSTALVAVCAEFMVSSIDHLVQSTPLGEAFVGLILLPIVGNAAEHVTAVTVAAKNKMDLAIGVAVGSSIQIALFVTPIVILLGWAMDKPMGLYFNIFETVTLFASTFIVNFLVLDGRSNYLEGTLLCASYVIIAVAAFFYPSEVNQSVYGTGGG